MLHIDKYYFEIACAGQCINPPEAMERAGLPKGTIVKISNGDDLTPEEVGKIAKALQVKPIDITTKGGFGINFDN